MKTNLFGKSNAVLIEEDTDNILGIISCGKNEDITKKLIQAISDHFVVPKGTDIKLYDRNSLLSNYQPTKVLTNQETVSFSATWVEDEQELIRDFEITICATY